MWETLVNKGGCNYSYSLPYFYDIFFTFFLHHRRLYHHPKTLSLHYGRLPTIPKKNDLRHRYNCSHYGCHCCNYLSERASKNKNCYSVCLLSHSKNDLQKLY